MVRLRHGLGARLLSWAFAASGPLRALRTDYREHCFSCSDLKKCFLVNITFAFILVFCMGFLLYCIEPVFKG